MPAGAILLTLSSQHLSLQYTEFRLCYYISENETIRDHAEVEQSARGVGAVKLVTSVFTTGLHPLTVTHFLHGGTMGRL